MAQHLENNNPIQNLQRVRYVTANYRDLQGLKIVPLAIFFVAFGALLARGPTWFTDSFLTFVLFLVGAAIFVKLGTVIERYYERKYGRVDLAQDSDRHKWLDAFGFIGIVIVSTIVEDNWNPPVDTFGSMMAAYLLVSILVDVRHPKKFIYLRYKIPDLTASILIMLLIVVVSLLPLFGMENLNPWPLYLIGIGLVGLIVGIVDHLILVRTLKPVPEDDNGTGV